jgi:hypothetical protein
MVKTLIMAVLLASLPVAAAANQPDLNGAINPREPNFFIRGREQFEREIQLLLKRSHSSVDTPLQISPQQQRLIQEQFELLENRKPGAGNRQQVK